jgi:hypothetical protein
MRMELKEHVMIFGSLNSIKAIIKIIKMITMMNKLSKGDKEIERNNFSQRSIIVELLDKKLLSNY